MTPDVDLSEGHLDDYASTVSQRLTEIRRRIEGAGGDLDTIRIVAVTKTFGLDAVIAAQRAGIVDVGENYADELVNKAEAMSAFDPRHTVRWHFLGELQRNKISKLKSIVDCYQGIDRFEEGEALARRAPGASILIEVNTDLSPNRPGVAPSVVPDLVRRLSTLDLRVDGLMTVAPPGGGEGAARAFHRVTTLRAALGLREASMGMSEDLEIAVAEGSTMIRVGRALFGPRP